MRTIFSMLRLMVSFLCLYIVHCDYCPSECSCTSDLYNCTQLEAKFPSNISAYPTVKKIKFTKCFFNIPTGAFSGLPLLKEILIEHSTIGVIKEGAFKGLHNLTSIRFTGSIEGSTNAQMKLIIVDIESGAFDDIRYIDSFSIEWAKIDKIHAHAFKEVDYIKTFSVTKSYLVLVESEAFAGLNRVLKFILINVWVDSADSQLFDLTSTIVVYKMNKVVMPVLPAGIFPQTLVTLNASQNDFGTMECTPFGNKTILDLTWKDNNITCDCRLLWVFKTNLVSDHILSGFQCSEDDDVTGRSLSSFGPDGADLPCPDGVEEIPYCDMGGGGGDGDGNGASDDGSHVILIVSIVVPIVVLLLIALVLVVVCKRKRKWAPSRIKSNRRKSSDKTPVDDKPVTFYNDHPPAVSDLVRPSRPFGFTGPSTMDERLNQGSQGNTTSTVGTDQYEFQDMAEPYNTQYESIDELLLDHYDIPPDPTRLAREGARSSASAPPALASRKERTSGASSSRGSARDSNADDSAHVTNPQSYSAGDKPSSPKVTDPLLEEDTEYLNPVSSGNFGGRESATLGIEYIDMQSKTLSKGRDDSVYISPIAEDTISV